MYSTNCTELKKAINEFRDFYDSIEELKIYVSDCYIKIEDFNKVAPKNKKKIKDIFNSYGFDTIAKREGYLLVR